MPSVKILSPAMATTLEELEEEVGYASGTKKKRCVRTEERTASQPTQVQGGHVPPKSSNISPLDLNLCSPHTVGRTTEDVNPSFCSPLIRREQNGDSLFFVHESPHLKNGHDFRHCHGLSVPWRVASFDQKRSLVCSCFFYLFIYIFFLFLFPGKICQSLYMEANAWTFNQGLAGFSNVDLLLWIWPASPLSLARET